MDNWLEVVSLNIKRLKKKHKLSQEELAEKVGCSRSVIRDLEAKSKAASASVEMLAKISEELGVTLAELLTDPETIKPAPRTDSTLNLSIITGYLGAVPNKVYELAQKISPDDPAWEIVEAALEDAVEDGEENGNKENHS